MEQHVYRPLRRYLMALPPAQQQVQLSLNDLETLLGPRTRNSFPAWTPLGVVDAAASPGFRAHFDRQRAAITFTRQASARAERT